MTALLSCDGCGQIVSDRPDDADPTAQWLCLSTGPTIGGNPLGIVFPTITDEPPEVSDLSPVEPERHFCGRDCLAAWAGRRE